MLDRVTSLQVFARVAGLGSLAAAARALAMSQTMATKHVAALEARLGVKLLHRTTRRVSLTEAGRRYLETIERVLGDLAEADAAASIEAVEVTGTLRLNVPVTFGIREIAPRLPELARRHPGLTIDLGLNDRHVDLVEEGWDLALRIGTVADQSLVMRKLAPCRMIVCAAPSYLTARGTPATTAELSHHNCLGYTLSRSGGSDRWVFGRGGRTSVAVSGTLKASNGDALTMAAVAGLGIAYQPSFLVAREIAAGQLVALSLDEPTTELDGVFAVYPATRRPPAKVRAAIDFFAEQFSGVPPWER
jgi:DNA-binding transcriptional LysR family regulator